MKVIDDVRVHDSKGLSRLLEDIIKSGSMTAVSVIGKLFADGS